MGFHVDLPSAASRVPISKLPLDLISLVTFFDPSCAILQELRIRALFLLDAPFLTASVFCRSFFRNRHPFAGQFGQKALVISSPNEAGTPFLLLWHPEGRYLISFAQDISAFSQAGNASELPFIYRTVSHRFCLKVDAVGTQLCPVQILVCITHYGLHQSAYWRPLRQHSIHMRGTLLQHHQHPQIMAASTGGSILCQAVLASSMTNPAWSQWT
jgi:hypothetical protein